MEYLPPHPPSAKTLADKADKAAEYTKYSTLPEKATVEKTKKALEDHGIKVSEATSKDHALALIKEAIPKGSSVYNTASTSLWEIGWEDFIRTADHGIKSVNQIVRAENDQEKRKALRQKEAPSAEFALTSVDGITEDGQLYLVDSSGTRTGPVATAAQVIVVAGTHKIVPTLAAAIERVEKYSEPVERARLAELYGKYLPPTWGYTTTLSYRNEYVSRGRVHVILVPEAIGH